MPNPAWIYRITHFQNLEYILRHGMFIREHPLHDPNYINIGNRTLTQERSEYPIGLEGLGNLGDYVPFYFGRLSIMLFNIKTGHGVDEVPQNEIVYICCKLDIIEQKGLSFVYTDGHAKNLTTRFFTDLNDLQQVDHALVNQRYWSNTSDDNDRKRRKQAEFLIKFEVLPGCISAIVVFDEEKRNFAAEIAQRLGIDIPIHIDTQKQFYY